MPPLDRVGRVCVKLLFMCVLNACECIDSREMRDNDCIMIDSETSVHLSLSLSRVCVCVCEQRAKQHGQKSYSP